MSGVIIIGGGDTKLLLRTCMRSKSLYFILFMLSPSISLTFHFLFTLPNHAKMRHNLQATTSQGVQ